MRKGRALLLVLAGLALVALRAFAAPRPLELGAPSSIVLLRSRVALAGLVAGAGFAVAAVAAQAQAREASVDASLTGPVWGALPALLVPGPLLLQGVIAIMGAGLVAWLTGRGPGGFSSVLARGVAVAGLVVSLAAAGLFLGPGLTPSTATVFLHAALGGRLLQATWEGVLLGGGVVAGAGAGLTVGLDGAAQALAWPGELPVGVLSLVLASALLSWKVVPRDRG